MQVQNNYTEAEKSMFAKVTVLYKHIHWLLTLSNNDDASK